MTHDLTRIDDWPAGDYRKLTFDVDLEDGSNKDISGGTIEWELVDPDEDTVVLSLADGSVSLTDQDLTSGTFAVEVGTGATAGLDGRYREELQITDGVGRRLTFRGWAYIQAG